MDWSCLKNMGGVGVVVQWLKWQNQDVFVVRSGTSICHLNGVTKLNGTTLQLESFVATGNG